MDFGLNLYSIRTLIQENQYLPTVLKLKKLGFQYIQFSGAPFNWLLLQKTQEETGLKIVLTHVPMDDILHNTQALIDKHLKLGCTNIGLGMMPLDIIKDESKCLETLQALNDAGKIFANQGCKLFYHFHHFEFLKLSNGNTIIDYMIENCPYINFTADTYWIQYGGGDIFDYLRRMTGRIECIHLKDYQIVVNKEGKLVPQFAPLGQGNLNIRKIVEAAKAYGVKYFLIEQDNAVDYENPLDPIQTSVEYINKHLHNL